MANQYKNKVIYNGTTLMDISDTTAIASDVGLGKEFYTASGAKAQGTAVTGNAISIVDTIDTNGGTIRTITAVDISDTTAVAADVASGKYFYTANGTKTAGSASGSSGTGGQTATGTVTGSGTNILEIPCNFEPDLIYVYGDMSDDVTNRGIVSMTIIKDTVVYMSADTSSSNADEFANAIYHGIVGYNETDTSAPHATLSNGTLSLDTAILNSSAGRWLSGQTYTYELSTLGTGGSGSSATLTTKTITLNGTYDAEDDSADGYSEVIVNVQGGASMTEISNTYGTELVIASASSSTPSATRHTLYFEYEDETSETIYVYYDDAIMGTAITSTIPTTHSNKTVTSAQLDGVEWYSYTPAPTPSGNYITVYDGNVEFYDSGNNAIIEDLVDMELTTGEIFRTTIDGTAYITAESQVHPQWGAVYFGNVNIWDETDDGTGLPFCAYKNEWGLRFLLRDGGSPTHTIKIERQVNS